MSARNQENAGMEVGGKCPETQYRAGKDMNLQSQKTQFKLAQSIHKSVSKWVSVCGCVNVLGSCVSIYE